MAVTAKTLARFLYNSLQENPSKHKDVIEAFLEFIEEKNLLPLLSHVVSYIEKFDKEDKDKEILKITLQQEHADSVIKDIKRKIKSPDKIKTEIIIDENIKGGFIAQYNNVVFDASVATQLERVKDKLVS